MDQNEISRGRSPRESAARTAGSLLAPLIAFILTAGMSLTVYNQTDQGAAVIKLAALGLLTLAVAGAGAEVIVYLQEKRRKTTAELQEKILAKVTTIMGKSGIKRVQRSGRS